MLHHKVSAALLLLVLQLYTPAGASASSWLVPLQPRPIAVDFTLPDVLGKPHTLSELRGSVVLINFWATWCPPCRQEMPGFQRAWTRLKDTDFRVLAIAVGEDVQAIDRFYHSLDTPLTFTLLPDPENKISRRWQIHGLPTTFVVDRVGRIAYVAEGPLDWSDPDAIRAVRALIEETHN